MFAALFFLLGDLSIQACKQLPSTKLLIAMGMICMVGAAYKPYRRYFIYVCVFILGAAFSDWYAQSILSWSLPKAVEGKPILVTGYVASLPSKDQWQTSFLFKLANESALIKLSSRTLMQPVKVGDKWQWRVKLKRIHSTQNIGAFDYEAWALQKGLRATGYILASPDNQLLAHSWYRYPIDQIRQRLQEKILAHLPASPTAPWLLALIIGERNGIRQADWQILRNTGTNHLMAIAGLHIGIMAGFAHCMLAWLWRRSARLVLWFPAPLAGACAALLTALLYAALAGFSIPTQRASIMLTIFIFTLLARRQIHSWTAWSLALLVVLLINPLSVLTESFWLSFATIALIIYGMSGRMQPTGWWWKWGRVQWVIGLGLIPITLSLFQECSLISFVANCVAIPWLAILILPFCFLSGIFLIIAPALGAAFLGIADKCLAGLWVVLTWFANLNLAAWHQAIPSQGILLLSVLAVLCLLLPAGLPGRWFGLLWLLPLLFYQPTVPTHGSVWLTVLDVGQGLAVVVQTKQHTLVYDAGPKYNDNFDMGESVVVPYLHTLATKRVDLLVISHGDNDHIGGAGAILNALPVTAIKTSVPADFAPRAASYCLMGDTWQWDGVRFTFLYPTMDALALGNDSSCVLQIDNGSQRILLAGDIEKYAEKALLAESPTQLAATILIAPHHGSKTSALRAFVEAVQPRYVLYATGYRNRYHFPHPSVVATYTALEVEQLNTAQTGMIQFKLQRDQPITSPYLHRLLHKRYWYD